MILLAAYLAGSVWKLFFTPTPKEYRLLVFCCRIVGLAGVYVVQLLMAVLLPGSPVAYLIMFLSWGVAWYGTNDLAASLLEQRGYKAPRGIRMTSL